jgi:hypothetical protein
MVRRDDFHAEVPLPPGLDCAAIRRAAARVVIRIGSKSDWKYEKSTAGVAGGGRTHTFGVVNPAAKLRGKAVYQRSDIVIRNSKPVARNGD